MLLGVAALLFSLGVVLGEADRNWFVGNRTPYLLSSDAVWKCTHAVATRLFTLTGVSTPLGVLLGTYAVYFLVVPPWRTAVGTVASSYVPYERLERGEDAVSGSTP